MSAQEAPNEVEFYLQRREDLRIELGELARQGADIAARHRECLENIIGVNDWLRYCNVDTSAIERPPINEPVPLHLVD